MPNDYVDEMIQKLAQRLQKLELKAATSGINTPVEILTEIESIQEQIQTLTMSTKSIVSVELLKTMEPMQIWKRLYDAIWELEIIVYSLKKSVENDRIRIQNKLNENDKIILTYTHEITVLKRAIIFLFITSGVSITILWLFFLFHDRMGILVGS